MDPLNKELLRSIELTKSTNSRIALKAKDRLVKTIQKSEKLVGIIKLRQLNEKDNICKNMSDEDIKDLRTLALAETLNRLDKYKPTKAPVMAFVNYKVKSIYRTERNKLYRNKTLPIYFADYSSFPKLLVENEEKEQERHRLLREFILEDPEGILGEIKTTNNVTLQQILLMLLDGKKWKEIEDELQISLSTAESCFKRSMKKLEIRNYFDKYLR